MAGRPPDQTRGPAGLAAERVARELLFSEATQAMELWMRTLLIAAMVWGMGALGAPAASASDRGPATVKSHIRKNLGPIRGCYQRELEREPGLDVRMTLRFGIGESGEVRGVRVAGEMPDSLRRCVRAAVEAWPAFPAGGQGLTRVSYPIHLKSR